MDEKQCTKCEQVKPVDEFCIRRRRGRTERNSSCKKCCSVATGAYNKAHRKERSDYERERQNQRHLACPDERRLKWVRNRYHLSAGEFTAMWERQGGCCRICNTALELNRDGFAIDHDHACCPGSSRSCGKCVRGILCGSCNKGLGWFRDNPDLLRAAAGYIEQYQEDKVNGP